MSCRVSKLSVASKIKSICVVIHQHIAHVDAHFLEQHATQIDLILDATDNFETRQLINDFAYLNKVPWIYGGVVQSTYAHLRSNQFVLHAVLKSVHRHVQCVDESQHQNELL